MATVEREGAIRRDSALRAQVTRLFRDTRLTIVAPDAGIAIAPARLASALLFVGGLPRAPTETSSSAPALRGRRPRGIQRDGERPVPPPRRSRRRLLPPRLLRPVLVRPVVRAVPVG